MGWGQGCRQVCHEAIIENSSVPDNYFLFFFYFGKGNNFAAKGKGRVTECDSDGFFLNKDLKFYV